jgi:hypothetical protein
MALKSLLATEADKAAAAEAEAAIERAVQRGRVNGLKEAVRLIEKEARALMEDNQKRQPRLHKKIIEAQARVADVLAGVVANIRREIRKAGR